MDKGYQTTTTIHKAPLAQSSRLILSKAASRFDKLYIENLGLSWDGVTDPYTHDNTALTPR